MKQYVINLSLIFIAFSCLIMLVKVYEYTEPGHRTLRTVSIGDSIADVKRKMNSDSRVVLLHEYYSNDVPSHYYIEGFQYETRKIEYLVLIYRAGAHEIAYFYVNYSGHVDYIYIGKS